MCCIVYCILLFLAYLLHGISGRGTLGCMKHVTIYSTPSCGWCKAAKQYFAEHDVPFTEKDVASDAAAREEMLAKSKQMGVPVIDVEGEIVIGFNQARLAELLEIS